MRITFLGDIMVKAEQMAAYQCDGGYDFSPAVRSIKKEFASSDLIIANLETPVVVGGGVKYTHEKYSFNAPIALPEALKEAGVDMVITANNHCLDRGKEGLVKTIENLRSCGLESLGTHSEKEDSYLIKEIDGIKVGFLAFTYGTNAFANACYLSKEERYLVDLLQKQELSDPFTRILWQSHFFPVRCVRALARRMHVGQFDRPVYERRENAKRERKHYQDTIAKCRNQGAEYIVACLHIGGQYNVSPTGYTMEVCEVSRKLGVNAVLANHEHVIHGLDWEHISDTSFCIYSLGNFLSSAGVICEPYDKLAQYSVAVNIDLIKQDHKKIRAEYSIVIFCNILDENNKITNLPLADYIDACGNNTVREELKKDYNILMNRICNTENISYPLQKEYKLNGKEKINGKCRNPELKRHRKMS